MIFFFATDGQLGNQLFHLAALDALCRGRQLGVLLGSAVLCDNFGWNHRNVFITRRAPAVLRRLLRKLAQYGLASHRVERRLRVVVDGHDYNIETGELVSLRESWVPLTLIEDAFLQSEVWVREDLTHRLKFPPPVLDDVRRFAAEHHIDWETTIFVHVRRGDYTKVSPFDAGPPALPPAWYVAGIERLKTKMPISQVIFTSDDADYVRVEFAGVSPKIVVSRSQLFDLCVMAHCASGVLSASSFSWWGAMLGPLRVPPVAPKHWVGWRRNITFPVKILSHRFDVVDVPQLEVVS